MKYATESWQASLLLLGLESCWVLGAWQNSLGIFTTASCGLFILEAKPVPMVFVVLL